MITGQSSLHELYEQLPQDISLFVDFTAFHQFNHQEFTSTNLRLEIKPWKWVNWCWDNLSTEKCQNSFRETLLKALRMIILEVFEGFR